MQIKYLADCPDCLPVLARWHHQEWLCYNPGDSLAKRIERMREHLGRRRVPTTFVALSDTDGQPLGSAALVAHDMSTRMDLTPWLASVFVAPEYRRRGIASALVRRVVQEAADLGVPRLFLFTPDQQNLYARLGWQTIERAQYMGEAVVVMELTIRPIS
jgi:N-acetylglutamate synthase-like GNAT family acetyltransferase